MENKEYETMFRVEDAHWWYRGLRALLQQQMERHAPPRPRKILDIGCGTGATLAYLADQGSAFGMDIASLALDRCARRGRLRTAQASALAAPFDSGVFEIALMLDVLYHRQIPDMRVPLREAHRVLKPGGVLLVNVPAYQWLRSSHDIAIHTRHRFTRGELAGLLQDTEFDVRQCAYWNSLLLPAIVAMRLARRKQRARGSDLEDAPSPLANRVFGALLRAERGLLAKRLGFPFGLSIFAVARKK